jgi:hypothetical protein
MMRTYQIHKRKNTEVYDWFGGYLGCIDAHSKQRALDKAAKRWKIAKEQLSAIWQAE